MKNIDPTRFQQAFSRQMTRRGFTIDDLRDALRARIGKAPAQSTVSYWTRGMRTPSQQWLPDIIALLDIEWTEIEPDPPPDTRPVAPTTSFERIPTKEMTKLPVVMLRSGQLRTTRRKEPVPKQLVNEVAPTPDSTLALGKVFCLEGRIFSPDLYQYMVIRFFASPVPLAQLYEDDLLTNGLYWVSWGRAIQFVRLNEIGPDRIQYRAEHGPMEPVTLNSSDAEIQIHAQVMYGPWGPM